MVDILDIAKVLTGTPAVLFLILTSMSFLLVIDGGMPGEMFRRTGKATLVTWGVVFLFEGAYCLGILFPEIAPVAPYLGCVLGGIECLAMMVIFALALGFYLRDRAKKKPSE